MSLNKSQKIITVEEACQKTTRGTDQTWMALIRKKPVSEESTASHSRDCSNLDEVTTKHFQLQRKSLEGTNPTLLIISWLTSRWWSIVGAVSCYGSWKLVQGIHWTVEKLLKGKWWGNPVSVAQRVETEVHLSIWQLFKVQIFGLIWSFLCKCGFKGGQKYQPIADM